MLKKITASEADCIIYSRRPFGLFYLLHKGTYVGIDNLNGHAWTEEISSLYQCKKWLLKSLITASPLEEAA